MIESWFNGKKSSEHGSVEDAIIYLCRAGVYKAKDLEVREDGKKVWPQEK